MVKKERLESFVNVPLADKVRQLEGQMRALLTAKQVPYLHFKGDGVIVPGTNSEIAYIYILASDGFLYVKYKDGSTQRLDTVGDVTDHGLQTGLDDPDHNAIYYTEAEVDALLHAEGHAARHAAGAGDNLSAQSVEVKTLQIDGTSIGDIRLEAVSGIMSVRKGDDSANANIIANNISLDTGVKSDVIAERSADAGVTVDGVLLKDNLIAAGAVPDTHGETPSTHHDEGHDVASHSDTTATGPELETLTDASDADALHAHARVASHMDAYNGSFLEPFTFAVTSNGTTITGVLDKNPTGDLTERFSTGYSTFTSGGSIALTPGSDTSPVTNFVYILRSSPGTLVKSTSGWPTTEHNRIAEVVLQSAATTQSEGGALVNHFWNDFTKGTNGQGHHTHAWARLRIEHAVWSSGNVITWTITTNGGAADNVDLATTAGKVYQLHLHDVGAKDTSGADNVRVVNDNASPYTEITDFNELLTDSAGGSMSGRYFNLVVWMTVSSGSEKEHLFVNLPSGSYNKEKDALADVSGYTDFGIPSDFRGDAFLVTRITLKHSPANSGTWTSVRQTDLRGQVPNIIAGGGTAAITTEFADNAFKVFDDGDPTKEMSFQVSRVTAGQTRVMTVPDSDIMLHGGTHHEKAESHIPMVVLTVEQSF